MPTFRTQLVVHLPDEALVRAKVFAEAVIDTVNYGDSYQAIKKKIHDDHFVSKLGEEAVRHVFDMAFPGRFRIHPNAATLFWIYRMHGYAWSSMRT